MYDADTWSAPIASVFDRHVRTMLLGGRVGSNGIPAVTRSVQATVADFKSLEFKFTNVDGSRPELTT